MPGHTAMGFFLTLPFGEHVAAAGGPEASPPSAATAPATAPPPAAESEPARLGRLQAALVALGLERVRVGRVERHWVVEYQNHRYGRHELDAAGLVLGLAAQAAPAEVERIVLSALKTGQPVMTLAVSAQAWRDFVRDGGAGGALQASLQLQRGQGFDPRLVDWLSDTPGPATVLQLRISAIVTGHFG